MRYNRIILTILLGLMALPAQAADLWRPEGQPAFMDANGNPYASAKLCYFDAGTTSARTVYKDASAATPWAQPITLNAGGGLDDPVYVPTGSFKEVLRSADATTCSDGTALFTSDSIPGALDVTTLGIDFARPDTPVLSKASAYTVQIADLGKVINVDATGGAVTVTLPSAITAGDGAVISVRKTDGSANAVTLQTVGGQTVDGSASYAIGTRYDNVTIVGDGASWYSVASVIPGTVAFADLASAAYDTDGTLAANSDTKIPTQKAVKTYADNLFAAGISWLAPAHVATTANVAIATDLENGDTIDGQTLVTGERVLVKNQSTPAQNGIYVTSSSGAASRATDIDAAAEFAGATVFVETGTANEGTQWTQTETITTLDTDAVEWVNIASGITYSADNTTLQLTGTQFAVKDSGIDNDAMADNSIGADEIIAGSIPKADLIAAVQQALVPVGTVFPFAGVSVPSGYLLAYGQCVSEATYADLFAAFGSVDIFPNSCTAGNFGIPDLRGRVVAASDNMGGVAAGRLTGVVAGSVLGAEATTSVVAHTHTGSVSGSVTGSTASDSHNHGIDNAGGTSSVSRGTGSSFTYADQSSGNTNNESHSHGNGSLAFSDSFTTASTGDAAVSIVQPTIALGYIIKF